MAESRGTGPSCWTWTRRSYYTFNETGSRLLELLSQSRGAEEMAEQENQLTCAGMKYLGRIRPSMTGLDAGCGRGGASLMIASKTGCRMTGISLSSYQVNTARKMASGRRLSGRVKFHHGNMLRSARLCVKGGRMLGIAWVKDPSRPGARRMARLIDSACITKAHPAYPQVDGARRSRLHQPLGNPDGERGVYHQLADKQKVHEDAEYEPPRNCGWTMVEKVDFTAAAARYWRLRSRSSHATGTERFMTPAFASGAMRYLLYAYRRD